MRETIIGSQGLGYLLMSGCRCEAEGNKRVQPKLGVNRPRVGGVGGDLSNSRRVVARRVGEAGSRGVGIRIALKRLSPAKWSTGQFRLPSYVGLRRVVLSTGLNRAEILERLLLLLHTIRRCTCWRANTKRILAVGKADSSPLHEAI